jgi:hypothetical protein
VLGQQQAESFFSILKNERVYRTAYATKMEARRDSICHIEGLYSSRRRRARCRCRGNFLGRDNIREGDSD